MSTQPWSAALTAATVVETAAVDVRVGAGGGVGVVELARRAALHRGVELLLKRLHRLVHRHCRIADRGEARSRGVVVKHSRGVALHCAIESSLHGGQLALLGLLGLLLGLLSLLHPEKQLPHRRLVRDHAKDIGLATAGLTCND